MQEVFNKKRAKTLPFSKIIQLYMCNISYSDKFVNRKMIKVFKLALIFLKLNAKKRHRIMDSF